MIGCRTISK